MKNRETPNLAKIFGVVVCLYLFLIGIGGMGASFKGEFKDTAARLLEATSSPMVGLFIGILATTIVQSSLHYHQPHRGLSGSGCGVLGRRNLHGNGCQRWHHGDG